MKTELEFLRDEKRRITNTYIQISKIFGTKNKNLLIWIKKVDQRIKILEKIRK